MPHTRIQHLLELVTNRRLVPLARWVPRCRQPRRILALLLDPARSLLSALAAELLSIQSPVVAATV